MSMPLWTWDEIAAATGARLVGSFAQAKGVSIDTRTLQSGDLFLAIKGDVYDAHDFVHDALAKGAAAAMVSEDRAGELADAGALVVVPDVLDAMRRMGIAARRRTAAAVVAVTGSVGKTGTKEALRLALARQGETHASAASYNNHWGVPLTLARMPRESAYGIFEIGMNHPFEILPLVAMVRPQVALITTVEPVHIEFFRSISGIADAKGEIFSRIEPGGTAVINRDSPYFERLKAHALASSAGRIVSFGEHEAADVRAERIVLKPDFSMIEARVLGQPIAYRLGTPGRHIAMNSLGVLAVVKALGADIAQAAMALCELKPPVGRGERTMLNVEGGSALLIDESYNANPASMRAALGTLGSLDLNRGRRIAVLGDMGELGASGPDLHRGLAEAVEANRIDLLFAAGSLMQNLVDALPPGRVAAHTPTSADLIEAVASAIRPGDAVMVKGSLSTRMGLIVKALKQRFGAGVQREAVKG